VTNLVTGPIPSLMIFVFVSSAAYNGNIKHNPYNFENLEVTELVLRINSEIVPTIPIKYDFPKYNVSRGFNYVNEQLGLGKAKTNGLSVDDYCKGFTYFAFDLTPDSSANEKHFSSLKNGTVWCTVNFGKKLENETTLLYYMQFEKLATIDKDRNLKLEDDG
jgi:hypothetical protein